MTAVSASSYQGRPAVSGGWFYVPYEAYANPRALEAEKRKLVHRKSDGGTLRMFKDVPERRYIGVPRYYGMVKFPWLPVTDERTDGAPMIDAASYRLPSPFHPAVLEPEKQAKFMADLDRAFIEQQHFLAEASTGTGKTVCGTRSAIIHGRRTAILLPLERLMDMWHDTLTGMFGVPAHRIGIVQSDRCEYEDKDFVLCMMKSLGMRRYHPDFYSSIGTLIPDEAHNLCSSEKAMVTAQFPARIRCGLSATLEKTDGSDKVLFWHIGPKHVRSEAMALPCDIYVKDYDDRGRMAAVPRLVGKRGEPPPPNHGFRVKKLTQDETRNRVLTELIFRLWRQGKQILAIGDSIGHIQHIMDLCVMIGIPRDQLGQCTGVREERELKGMRHGVPIYGPVRKVKIGKEEFRQAKENARVVFATYGCFKEGVDEQRLDAVVPLTPRGKDKQMRGRVRRPFPNKTSAIYVCLRDVGDWMSMGYFDVKAREWAADPTCRVHYGKI